MAEQKGSLRDRLKKGAGAAPAAAPQEPTAPAPGGIAGPPGFDAPVAPPFGADPVAPAMPGPLPGLGGFDDPVAPPPFVVEQQQREAAAAAAAAAAAVKAAKAAAAAADPFGSDAVAAPAPQEVRLVIDEKPVDEAEVGRSNRPVILAVVVAAVVGIGAGFLIGGQRERGAADAATRAGVESIRGELSRLATVLADARTNIDRAHAAAGLTQAAGEAGAQPAQRTPPRFDAELVTWMQGQLSTSQEPPFTPNAYAGRVGRLRGDVVQKLAQLTLQLNELWRQMGNHVRRTNQQAIAAALDAADDRMYVAFSRLPGQDNQPGRIVAQVVNGTPVANSPNITITGANIPANTTRALFIGQGPLTPDNLLQATVFVNARDGLGPEMARAATGPLAAYLERVRDLKALIDQLGETQRQVTEALGGGTAR